MKRAAIVGILGTISPLSACDGVGFINSIVLNSSARSRLYRVNIAVASRDELKLVGCRALGYEAQWLVDAFFQTATRRDQIIGPERVGNGALTSFTLNGESFNDEACRTVLNRE